MHVQISNEIEKWFTKISGDAFLLLDSLPSYTVLSIIIAIVAAVAVVFFMYVLPHRRSRRQAIASPNPLIDNTRGNEQPPNETHEPSRDPHDSSPVLPVSSDSTQLPREEQLQANNEKLLANCNDEQANNSTEIQTDNLSLEESYESASDEVDSQISNISSNSSQPQADERSHENYEFKVDAKETIASPTESPQVPLDQSLVENIYEKPADLDDKRAPVLASENPQLQVEDELLPKDSHKHSVDFNDTSVGLIDSSHLLQLVNRNLEISHLQPADLHDKSSSEPDSELLKPNKQETEKESRPEVTNKHNIGSADELLLINPTSIVLWDKSRSEEPSQIDTGSTEENQILQPDNSPAMPQTQSPNLPNLSTRPRRFKPASHSVERPPLATAGSRANLLSTRRDEPVAREKCSNRVSSHDLSVNPPINSPSASIVPSGHLSRILSQGLARQPAASSTNYKKIIFKN